MPTYDYICPENGREIAVFHAMSSRVSTWGELCALASMEPGPTPADTPVQRQIGTGFVLPRKPNELAGMGGSCCGTDGCGD